MAARGWAVAVLASVLLSACTTTVEGKAVRGSDQGSKSATSTPARDLLLKTGDNTPMGTATAIPVGDDYFTSATPQNCQAAVLFENSPLRPPGASDHAESAYQFGGPAMYAESVDIYRDALDVRHVLIEGFIAIAQCRRGAVGVTKDGRSFPMHMSDVSTSAPDAVVWVMSQAEGTCSYALAALPKIALLLAACDTQPGFPMLDWTAKRLAQISGRTA